MCAMRELAYLSLPRGSIYVYVERPWTRATLTDGVVIVDRKPVTVRRKRNAAGKLVALRGVPVVVPA